MVGPRTTPAHGRRLTAVSRGRCGCPLVGQLAARAIQLCQHARARHPWSAIARRDQLAGYEQAALGSEARARRSAATVCGAFAWGSRAPGRWHRLFFLTYFTMVFFFFQAEDGIRDLTVTGVQTCALPI